MSHWSDYDEREERESRLATPSEAVAEFGRNAGMDRPDQAWLLHDWDVWVKNPFYAGPPVPHPESDQDYHDDGASPLPSDHQPRAPRDAGDDDIPF